MDTRRKITGIFFLLLSAAPVICAFHLSIKKAGIRERMKSEMEMGSLQTIVLPAGKVIWMDKHEIWVNDHMFDIHSRILENGIFTFTGLYDKEETMLVENERESGENAKNDAKLLAKLFKCFPGIYLFLSPAENPKTSTGNTFYTAKSTFLTTTYHEIATPPPRMSSLLTTTIIF